MHLRTSIPDGKTVDRATRAQRLYTLHLSGPPSERWTRGHRKGDGAPFFAIPGTPPKRPDQLRPIYAVTTRGCTCPDRAYNTDERGQQVECAHILAVKLWVQAYKDGVIQLPGPPRQRVRPATELDVETDWSAYDQSVSSSHGST